MRPLPCGMSAGPDKASWCRSAAKSHFRVYSNAFQEPLPAPRWAVSKSAVGPRPAWWSFKAIMWFRTSHGFSAQKLLQWLLFLVVQSALQLGQRPRCVNHAMRYSICVVLQPVLVMCTHKFENLGRLSSTVETCLRSANAAWQVA